MPAILREAEFQFRRFLQECGERTPALVRVSSATHVRGDDVRIQVDFEDGRYVSFDMTRLAFLSAPSIFRSPEGARWEFQELWNRLRIERALAPPLVMPPTAEDMRIDLQPGAINYLQDLPPPEVPYLLPSMRQIFEATLMYCLGGDILRTREEGMSTQRQAEVEQEEQIRRRLDEAARIAGCTCPVCRPGPEGEALRRRQGKADARSVALMCDWLSPDQLAEWQKGRHFHVTGSSSGNRYRIAGGSRSFNVVPLDKEGREQRRLCFAPAGIAAIGDIMLAQKIALETDEEAALKVANVERGRLFEMEWRDVYRPLI